MILLAHTILAAAYWSHTPYGAAPDEGAHGNYIRYLAAKRTFPVLQAGDPRNYEAHHPPLYYILAVPFYLAARALGMSEPGAGVRLLSLVLGALSILVTYAAVKRFTPTLHGGGTALACAAFVAFLPMHLALSSSVSNDPLTELVFGQALLLAGRILPGGPNWRDTLLLGLVLGAGLLTKTTCVILFPVGLLAYILAWQRGADAKAILGHVSAALAVSLLVGGWWLARNAVIYGDPLAVSAFQKAFEQTAKPAYWLEKGLSWGWYFLLVGAWTFASFWGAFGHMNVFLPTGLYAALGVLTLGVAARSVPALLELRAGSEGARDMILVYATTAALVLLAFVRFNASFFQAQGRFLYPAIIPLSLAWVLGFERWLPTRIRSLSPAILASGMLALALFALFESIIPKIS